MPTTGAPSSQARAHFDFKSATLTLVALLLKTTDQALLMRELGRKLDDSPDFFANDPLVLDLSAIANSTESLDFKALVKLLKQHQVLPIAVRGGNEAQTTDALHAGLVHTPDAQIASAESRKTAHKAVREVIREVAVAVPVEVQVEVPVPATGTLVVDKPLRSGQRVYAKGGDIIVLGMVSHGAEVIADGHVHVYAPLRGRAVAGARGNTEARIFTTCMEAELVSIAGNYRAFDTALPAEMASKATQIKLVGEKLLITPV
jgi:septum site-determining protein MinC